MSVLTGMTPDKLRAEWPSEATKRHGALPWVDALVTGPQPWLAQPFLAMPRWVEGGQELSEFLDVVSNLPESLVREISVYGRDTVGLRLKEAAVVTLPAQELVTLWNYYRSTNKVHAIHFPVNALANASEASAVIRRLIERNTPGWSQKWKNEQEAAADEERTASYDNLYTLEDVNVMAAANLLVQSASGLNDDNVVLKDTALQACLENSYIGQVLRDRMARALRNPKLSVEAAVSALGATRLVGKRESLTEKLKLLFEKDPERATVGSGERDHRGIPFAMLRQEDLDRHGSDHVLMRGFTIDDLAFAEKCRAILWSRLSLGPAAIDARSSRYMVVDWIAIPIGVEKFKQELKSLMVAEENRPMALGGIDTSAFPVWPETHYRALMSGGSKGADADAIAKIIDLNSTWMRDNKAKLEAIEGFLNTYQTEIAATETYSKITSASFVQDNDLAYWMGALPLPELQESLARALVGAPGAEAPGLQEVARAIHIQRRPNDPIPEKFSHEDILTMLRIHVGRRSDLVGASVVVPIKPTDITKASLAAGTNWASTIQGTEECVEGGVFQVNSVILFEMMAHKLGRKAKDATTLAPMAKMMKESGLFPAAEIWNAHRRGVRVEGKAVRLPAELLKYTEKGGELFGKAPDDALNSGYQAAMKTWIESGRGSAKDKKGAQAPAPVKPKDFVPVASLTHIVGGYLVLNACGTSPVKVLRDDHVGNRIESFFRRHNERAADEDKLGAREINELRRAAAEFSCAYQSLGLHSSQFFKMGTATRNLGKIMGTNITFIKHMAVSVLTGTSTFPRLVEVKDGKKGQKVIGIKNLRIRVGTPDVAQFVRLMTERSGDAGDDARDVLTGLTTLYGRAAARLCEVEKEHMDADERGATLPAPLKSFVVSSKVVHASDEKSLASFVGFVPL